MVAGDPKAIWIEPSLQLCLGRWQDLDGGQSLPEPAPQARGSPLPTYFPRAVFEEIGGEGIATAAKQLLY